MINDLCRDPHESVPPRITNVMTYDATETLCYFTAFKAYIGVEKGLRGCIPYSASSFFS